MGEKVRVFVSHSFEENDKPLVERFLAILRQKKFQFDVQTARSPEPKAFGKKIHDWIDWADITIGLFTRRHYDEQTKHYTPPPYIISECSYAMGLYHYAADKSVHGFVEEGIQYGALGLPTAEGQEFPQFHRKQVLNGTVEQIEKFLLGLHTRYSSQENSRLAHAYKQKYLRKMIEVYRNGTAVIMNRTTFAIRNAALVVNRGNWFEHRLWPARDRVQLPRFAEMVATPLTERLIKPVFSCRLLKLNAKSLDMPMSVVGVGESPEEIVFHAVLPITIKNNDQITYEYVWSLPRMFAVYEEELPGEDDYNRLALRTAQGKIDAATMCLKFEKEGSRSTDIPLFSKEPFVFRHSGSLEAGPRDSDAQPLQVIDQDSVWITYECKQKDLDGALCVHWRPSSKVAVRRASEPADTRSRKPVAGATQQQRSSPRRRSAR